MEKGQKSNFKIYMAVNQCRNEEYLKIKIKFYSLQSKKSFYENKIPNKGAKYVFLQ